MRRIARLGVFALTFVALGQTAAFAQAIAGVVRDASGGVMPGVTIEASSPALIEKTRTVVTDGDGQYKIINLVPGTYSVTFTLTGFNTVKRDGIELTGDFTAPVNAEMKVGAIEETITVSGASPLIDTQSVTQKKSLTSDLISALPTGRSFQNLSVLVPGVIIGLASQDVGGTGGERYQTLSVHGSRGDQMPLVINGMPYNNMNNTGGGYNTTLVINTGTVQEMTVTTSGLSAESRSSGVLSNTIPKEGGNTYRGYILSNFANHGFQSNNLTDELKAKGLTRVNSVNKLWDANPTIGGPLAKDRVWFYGGFRSSGARNFVAGMYKNLRPTAGQYCPNPNGCVFGGVNVPYSQDVAQPAIGGDTWTRGETLNLTIQADQKNKFTVFGHFNQRLVDCNACSATTSPEAGIYFTHRPEYILQSTWTNPYTNRLLFEAGFTFYNERWLFEQQPTNINGYGPDAAISKLDNGTGYRYGSAANENPIGKAGNHQYNMRAAVNYVTGSHAFKFGMADMWGTRFYQYDMNQAQSWTLSNGVPTSITEYARPMTDLEHLRAALGVYAQDRWTIDRLTMNLGIRFDYHNAYVPAQDVPAIPFVPVARHYDAIYNVPNWKDISSRVGATYDIFGDGTTVVRGNYGKYVASESTNMATLNNRINTSVNQANRSWSDFNRNLRPDCNLQNPAAQDLSASGGDICGALDSNLGSLAIAAAYAPTLTSGFGVRPNDQEIAFGIQRQIMPNFSADFQFTRHWFGNFVASQDTIRVPSAYDPFCVTPAAASFNGFSLPNGATQICGFFNRNPNPAFTPTFLNVTRAKDVGDVTDVYTGYDVNLNARLPRGGTASGGFSIGHEVTDICDVIGKGTVTYAAVSGVISSSAGTLASTAAYPSKLYCHVQPPFQPDIKGLVSYGLPWWGVRASATLQNRPGPQILANYSINATNVATQTTLGRAVTGGTQTVQLIAPATIYGDRFTQIDLRLGRTFRAGRSRIQGTFDLYNLLNSSGILAQNNTFGTSWRTPTLILQGRLMKLGVQLDF